VGSLHVMKILVTLTVAVTRYQCPSVAPFTCNTGMASCESVQYGQQISVCLLEYSRSGHDIYT
jgi:hypothetical protein